MLSCKWTLSLRLIKTQWLTCRATRELQVLLSMNLRFSVPWTLVSPSKTRKLSSSMRSTPRTNPLEDFSAMPLSSTDGWPVSVTRTTLNLVELRKPLMWPHRSWFVQLLSACWGYSRLISTVIGHSLALKSVPSSC